MCWTWLGSKCSFYVLLQKSVNCNSIATQRYALLFENLMAFVFVSLTIILVRCLNSDTILIARDWKRILSSVTCTSNRKDCRYHFQSDFIYVFVSTYVYKIISWTFCHTNSQIILITPMLCNQMSLDEVKKWLKQQTLWTSDIHEIFNTFDIVKNYVSPRWVKTK